MSERTDDLALAVELVRSVIASNLQFPSRKDDILPYVEEVYLGLRKIREKG